MSVSNLLTLNGKSFQNINCNSLECLTLTTDLFKGGDLDLLSLKFTGSANDVEVDEYSFIDISEVEWEISGVDQKVPDGIEIHKIGDIVTVYVSGFVGTSGASLDTFGQSLQAYIPEDLRPLADISFPINKSSNGVQIISTLTILSTGFIRIYEKSNKTATIPNAVPWGTIFNQAFTYPIN